MKKMAKLIISVLFAFPILLNASSEEAGILLITPQMFKQPKLLHIPVKNQIESGDYTLSIYHNTGKKVFEKHLSFLPQMKTISGPEIFGNDIKLAAGYYLYRISGASSEAGFPKSNLSISFQDVSAAQLPGDSTVAGFSEFIYANNDSFPDIIIGFNSFNIPLQPHLLINNGSGFFANESVQRLPVSQMLVNDIAVFDADMDGDEDIYFANTTNNPPPIMNTDKLFLNDGQGFFSDATATHLPQIANISQNVDWGFKSSTYLPVTKYGVFDAITVDVNKDSLTDIVLANWEFIVTDDMGNPIDTLGGENAVFTQGANGTFIDETSSRMPSINRGSKLMKAADINNDGAPELYSINIGFTPAQALNVLYMNNGTGFFQDETASRLPFETVIWNNDAEFRDFDLDNDPDFFMINVMPGAPAGDFLYENNGGVFADISNQLPALIDFNTSCTSADIERDTDDDIFIAANDTAIGLSGLPDVLYQNLLVTTNINTGRDISPRSLQLFQNYPNPFNPMTTLSYQLPVATEVELIIYDLLGRQIRKLVGETKPAGFHEAAWDGKDETGKSVTSGVYIYRLGTGNYVQSKKMLLIRKVLALFNSQIWG
jgi:hypothetical protein